MASCYPSFDLAPPAPPTRNAPAPHKDYTRPLHVDCSVEYELPNQAKPPEGARSEPLLMIHPCYYRRAESQRRSPFINNLPTRTQSMVTVGGRRASQVPRLVQQQQQQQTAVSIQQPQHQTQQYQVQAVRYLDPSGRPEATTMLHQQQQHHQHMAVTNWNQMDASLVAAPAPVPVYSKPSVAAVKHMKRDPMLCRGGDFSSGSDSGVSVSAGHWTDSDRSPLAPELRLQRDFTATTDSGIGTPVDDKAVLSELLAATCGGGVEVNNNNNNTVLKEAVPRHQQPAVGVAAVAATPCTSCFLQPPVPYHHRLQQPWAGMTAPTASQHQPTARRARVALEPEHAAASRRASQVPWARSGGAAKRSRLATAQSHDVSTAAGTSWANQQQFVVAAAPEAASRPSWSTPVACRQQQEPQMVAPCGGGVKDCKTCCQQPPVKETPEQQWGSQYYGPCRGASEDNTRILWNNESMLRLFQV